MRTTFVLALRSLKYVFSKKRLNLEKVRPKPVKPKVFYRLEGQNVSYVSLTWMASFIYSFLDFYIYGLLYVLRTTFILFSFEKFKVFILKKMLKPRQTKVFSRLEGQNVSYVSLFMNVFIHLDLFRFLYLWYTNFMDLQKYRSALKLFSM